MIVTLRHYYLMKYIHQYLKKKKEMEPHERSTLQLMSIMRRDEGKDKINSFPYT